MQNLQPSNIVGQPLNQQVIYSQVPQVYANQAQLQQSYVPQQVMSTPIVNNQYLTQSPMTTVSQGFVTPMKYTQVDPTYVSQPQFIENTGVPMVMDPMAMDPTLGVDPASTVITTPVQENIVRDCVYTFDPTRVEFGRTKGIHILTFPGVELERTTDGKTIFGTIGNLAVLYFPDFDRFVLSLNGWKYALLKRLPVFSTEPSLTGPISYTLPTINGFYTLTITRVQFIEALKNFETILRENSKFTINPDQTPFRQQLLSTAIGTSGPVTTTIQDVSGAGFPLNPEMIPNQTGFINQEPIVGESMIGAPGMMLSPEDALAQLGHAQPAPLKGGQRLRRGFGRFLYKITKAHGTPNGQNLNMYHPRDIYNIKRTTETMAPCEVFPKKEVERWIIFNKDIANRYGFAPEEYLDANTSAVNMMNSPGTSEVIGRPRGYGSVDLGQGSLSNPIGIDRITCDRPSYTMVTGNYTTVAPSGKKNYVGYGGLPSSSDKFKSKMGRPRGERYQSLAGPRVMTIDKGTVVDSTVAQSTVIQEANPSVMVNSAQPLVESAVIQETAPSVVTRLEERFDDNTPIMQENYTTSNVFTQSPMFQLTQPIETVNEIDIHHLKKNYPGFVDMFNYTQAPVTEIIAQETYVQERPNLAQRIESGIMNDSQGVQNLSATFGTQVSAPENVIVNGPYTQEATAYPIQSTPTLLQRVENKIAAYDTPQVQTVYAQPTIIGQTMVGPQETVLTRDMQRLSLMDKMKGFFRGRKPAEEGGIPPEQLAKIRTDGTLHHYQA